jgi:hypothetical protein
LLSVFFRLKKRIIKIIFAFNHFTHVQSLILLYLALAIFLRRFFNENLLVRLKIFTLRFIFVLKLLELLASVLDIIICIVFIYRFISEMALLKSYLSIKILLLVQMFWVLELLFVAKRFLAV